MERLQKVIAASGVTSRRKAEELITKFKEYEHLLKGLTNGND